MVTVSPQEIRRELTAKHPNGGRSDAMAFLVVLAVFFFTLFGLGLSYVGGPLVWLMGQLLVAVAILQWFVLLHDLGHGCFFRTRIYNDIAGHVASFFVMLPFYPWRYIHSAHHTWTGWRDLDPTMSQVQTRELKPFQRAVVNFCWRYWVPIFALSFSFGNFWNMPKTFRRWPSRKVRARCAWSCLFVLLTALPIACLWPLIFLRVYGLAYLLYLVASDPLLLSQHSHIPQKIAGGENVAAFPFHEQDLYTRSLTFPHWISKWVLLYFDRHGVHHFFPTLPLYRLGSLELSVRNKIHWWQWLKTAKRIPAHRLLLETREETGISL